VRGPGRGGRAPRGGARKEVLPPTKPPPPPAGSTHPRLAATQGGRQRKEGSPPGLSGVRGRGQVCVVLRSKSRES
jgi:hypothetical protein